MRRSVEAGLAETVRRGRRKFWASLGAALVAIAVPAGLAVAGSFDREDVEESQDSITGAPFQTPADCPEVSERFREAGLKPPTVSGNSCLTDARADHYLRLMLRDAERREQFEKSGEWPSNSERAP
ncbi:hypothetical protein HJD18_03360 [Thermoleophilia bacterium SCSIO 60948]|nr:hypothetical protein HJD18_03360 [Thermoleophilia bacterium SCSIO 60948]